MELFFLLCFPAVRQELFLGRVVELFLGRVVLLVVEEERVQVYLSRLPYRGEGSPHRSCNTGRSNKYKQDLY